MNNYEKTWRRPVIKAGVICIALVMIISFLPNLYLMIRYGVKPTGGTFLRAWGAIALAYGAFYVVEPLSYYPAFGVAGSYLGVLTGSMANIRLPASQTAQKTLETEPGTKKAEMIGLLAIIGSVIVSTAMLTVFVIFGAYLLGQVPEETKAQLASLIVPAVFGALVVMFGQDEPKTAIIILPILVAMNFIPNIQYWIITVTAVVGSVLISRFLYVKGWSKTKKPEKVEAAEEEPKETEE